MSYDLQLRTGFFKTYRCKALLDQNGIKLHAIEPNADAEIFLTLGLMRLKISATLEKSSSTEILFCPVISD